MNQHTEILPINAASIQRAAFLIRSGETVVFPTETVYGLGADALNAQAVMKIFIAKQRPADNPLIAHIADLDALDALVDRVDHRAKLLMDRFWPGPLTLVLPKSSHVPDPVTAGLSTVAVRMPSHPAALALIREAKTPIAAPSANRSGKPRPTTAAHVYEDLKGRVPLILDGGPTHFGVESTVLDLSGEKPLLLRPGGVTVETLRELLPDTTIDPAVLAPLGEGIAAQSPGMRHRHYAPNARVWVVRGEAEAVFHSIRKRYDEAEAQGVAVAILCATNHQSAYGDRQTHPLGVDSVAMAQGLFAALRALDEKETQLILAESVETQGMGLALMNRLLRAANFDVEDVK